MTHQVRCTVCLHPQVADADAMTRAGKKDPDVGRALGLSTDAVRRHRIHHVAPAPSPSSTSTAGSPTLGPLADLEQQRAELAARDVSKMSEQQRNQVSDLRRKVSVEIARLRQPESVAESEWERKYHEQHARSQVIASVLERHPGVKAEVGIALGALRQKGDT